MLARLFTLASTLGAIGALGLAAATGLAGAAEDTHGDAVSAVAMGHGAVISNLAHTTAATGAMRGDVISDAAQMHGAAVRAVARTNGEKATATKAEDKDNDRDDRPATTTPFGQKVSALAKSTTLTGEAKGDAISTLARTHGAAMRAAHR